MVDAVSSGGVKGLRRSLSPVTIAGVIVACALIAPILAVFVAAAGETDGLWLHLSTTVLPRYVANTLILMVGVAAVSLYFGVSSAWIVTRYDFPGRSLFEWMLLLPAAVPGYLIAYTYTDFLEYAGPVQGFLRDLFGWRSARDYWFPEIRSMGGAVLVIGAVLYPYVYLMSRVAFLSTPASLYEVGRLAKRSMFWHVAFPMARPAIVAGLALVLMETISDFGTVEYFAIYTLTLGIFNVWLGMNSLPAAAQIACVAFLFVIALIAVERMARANKRFSETSRRFRTLSADSVSGGRAAVCFAICALPVVVGFVVPVGVLLSFVLKGHSLALNDTMISAAWNSISLSFSVAILTIAVAVFLGLVATYMAGDRFRRLATLASIGYAFPGTILAIGVITAGGYIDDGVSYLLQELFGIAYQGWLTSGIGLVIFACIVRFQAVGYGAVMSGLDRVPPNLMEASRCLGRTPMKSFWSVQVPLITPAMAAGGLLVFVDVMKELPMTLLLRPFNYDTLATFLYQYAKDELLEEAALPALMIVAAGVLPVAIMNATIRRLAKPNS